MQDELLPGEVEHARRLFELAEVLEAGADGLGHLEEVPLLVEHVLARELEAARVLVDVPVVGLHLAQQAARLVERAEDIVARVEVRNEFAEVLDVHLFLLALEGCLDRREPVVELLRRRDRLCRAQRVPRDRASVVEGGRFAAAVTSTCRPRPWQATRAGERPGEGPRRAARGWSRRAGVRLVVDELRSEVGGRGWSVGETGAGQERRTRTSRSRVQGQV